MDDASRFAKKRLLEATRAKRTATLLALGLGTAAVGLIVLLGVVLLDYWLMLVPSVRFGALALLCALVAGGLYKAVKMLQRPTSLKEAALDAEENKPALGCELSTAAEYLSGEKKPNLQYENDLASALEEKAATHLKKIDLPYWKRPIRPALMAGMLVLAVVVFTVLASGGFTALRRALAPWSNASYTQVEVLPGNVEVPIGKDVEVKSIFSGRIPKTARFQWQDAGNANWQFAALSRNEQGEYTYPLKNVRTALKYRVSGSDATSSEFTVEPYIPPDVKAWKVDLNYPSYTRLPRTTQDNPEITALRGSVASIEIAPTVKLSKAVLRFKEGGGISLKPQGNGFWKVDVTIGKDAEFSIDLADEKGRGDSNESIFKIKALPDEIPKVEIAEPGQDTTAQPTNSVAVKIKAMDDYGLAELKLVYHRLGGPEEIITAKRDGETNSEYSAEIPLSPLGLKQYELVAYHALAIDNNTLDGPGVGKSDVFFIEITDKEGAASKSQGQAGQKVNLLVIQKQIIADTTAIGTNTPSEKLEELALRQKDAADFARLYQKAIAAGGTNSPAAKEIAAAITDMEAAQASLEQRQAKTALPPEESALARLYKIVGMMPALQDMPIVPPKPKQSEKTTNQPPMLQVVLEEIKKKKEEEPNKEELAEALEEAKRLQEEQTSLSLGVQNTPDNPQGGMPGETKIDRSGKDPKKDSPMAKVEKPLGESEAKGKGKGKTPQEGSGKSEEQQEQAAQEGEKSEKEKQAEKTEEKSESEGKGKGDEGEKPGQKGEGEESEKSETEENQDALAQQEPQEEAQEKQTELSKATAELAEKLERMAGKGSRLGHGAAKKLNEAAANMQEAADAMRQRKSERAGNKGAQAGAALEGAVAMLERLVAGRAERVDVSKEDAPKQYEAVIAEYFKALSYDN